jgi:NAD(P)H-dependent FMN reductase
MRLIRPGLMLGMAAGYVLGAKAGRERYQQIQDMWRKAMRSPQAQTLQSEVRQTAATLTDAVEQKANNAFADVAEAMQETRERVRQGADSTTTPTL